MAHRVVYIFANAHHILEQNTSNDFWVDSPSISNKTLKQKYL